MIDDGYRQRLRETAGALGVSPVDLATIISYETGGTFDPMQAGPKTQWGQHRGLIQFGEPQAKQYGVDWQRPLESQLGSDGAVVRYALDRGFKPGGDILDLYSTINAGAPGLYDRTDENNGGAPGTVRDKVEKQFGPHREKARKALGVSDIQFDPEKFKAATANRGSGPGAQSNAPRSGGFDPEKYRAVLESRSPQATPTPEKPEQGYDGYADGLMRSVQDGALMGFGDNMGAALGAVAGADPESGKFLDYSRSFGDRYDANLALERKKRGAFAEENPVADTVAKVGGGVTSALAAAPALGIKAAASGGGRVLQATGAGASIGGVTAIGDGDGEATPIDVGIGATAGAGGALAGIPLSALASRVFSVFGKGAARIFRKGPLFDEAQGKITDEGRRRLISQGVDPDAVTRDLAEAFARSGGRAQAAGVPPSRIAGPDSFGIPLTRGQATGDVPQVALEESLRAGTRGDKAYRTMQAFDQRQGAAVGAARDALADRIAPAGNVDALDAADMAQAGIQRAAAEAKDAGSRAYAAFEEMGGGIKGSAAQGLMGRVARRFAADDIVPEASMTNTAQALKTINRMIGGAERGAIPFKRLESTRQRLNQLARSANRGSDGGDKYAIGAMMREYDEWLEDSVVNAISDGGPEAMKKVREARKLWSSYTKTFLGKNGADNTIRKIVEDELSPDQVMGWLIGSSKNVGGGQTATVMKKVRDVLGADSPEFMALKKATFDRITKNGDRIRGYDDMVGALGQFLDGKGKALSQQVFTPDELKRVREFRSALQTLQKPSKATNPSGSGYQVERGAQALWQGLAGAFGFATAGPGGAVGTMIAQQSAREFAGSVAARAAVKGITGPAPSLAAAIGGGGVSGGQAPGALP